MARPRIERLRRSLRRRRAPGPDDGPPSPPAAAPPETEPAAPGPPGATASEPERPGSAQLEPEKPEQPEPQAPEPEVKRPPPILQWFVRQRKPAAAAPPSPPEPVSAEPPGPEPPPPPARRTEALRDRLGAIGDGARRGAAAASRMPGALGRAGRQFWFSMSIYTRRRLGVALGVVALLLVLAFVAVPALPCGAPGGDVCPPSDDSLGLVPDDSLVYLHLNVDPNTEQYREARTVAGRIPTLAQQVTDRLLSRVPGPSGTAPDFAHDIQPWFGGQAALAVVPAGGRAAEEVQLLQIDDADAAGTFADSIATGTPQTTTYKGIEVSVDRRGLATASVDGFLVVGREAGVRDVIDAQSGAAGTGSLADDSSAQAALAALPDKRLADAYLSPDGIARLVGNPRGSLATLDAAIDPAASQGAAMALVASDAGIEVDVRSTLDSARAKAQPGFFSAFPSFHPSLIGSLPADSLAYLGIGDPGHALTSLLEQASANQPGLAAAVASLADRVKQLGKVDLASELLPSLGDEAAFAIESPPADSGKAGGGGQSAAPSSGAPYLEFLTSNVDAAKAGTALASLQAPIADALNASGGQAPAFDEQQFGDVTAHSVRVSPTVDLTYAVAESVLLIATDPAAVEQLVSGDGGLADAATFKEATDGLPDAVSVLMYLNLGGLTTLGEQAGLAADPAYQTFAPEIHKLQGLAVAVQQSSSELATDVRLVVGEDAATPVPLDGGGGGSNGN